MSTWSWRGFCYVCGMNVRQHDCGCGKSRRPEIMGLSPERCFSADGKFSFRRPGPLDKNRIQLRIVDTPLN